MEQQDIGSDSDSDGPPLTASFEEFRPIRSDSSFAQGPYDEITLRLRDLLSKEPSYTIFAAEFFKQDVEVEVTTQAPCIFLGVRDPMNVSAAEDALEIACRTSTGVSPLLLIYQDEDSEEVFEESEYSEYPLIYAKLKTPATPATSGTRAVAAKELHDGEIFHQEMALGASVGPDPEWKTTGKLTCLSHGLFLQSDKGVVYGLSAGHGFLGAKTGSNVTSPARADINKAKEVLGVNKPNTIAIRDRAHSAFLLDSASAAKRQTFERTDTILQQTTDMENHVLAAYNDISVATFAKICLVKKEASPVLDERFQRISGSVHERLDYALYKVTDLKRAARNRYLDGSNAQLLIDEVALDSELRLYSKHLGETRGTVSGILLFTRRTDPAYGAKDLQSHFVLMSEADRAANAGQMNKPGSSGGIWVEKRLSDFQDYAVGLHTGGFPIRMPTRIVGNVQIPDNDRAIAALRLARDALGKINETYTPNYPIGSVCHLGLLTRLTVILNDIKDEGHGELQPLIT